MTTSLSDAGLTFADNSVQPSAAAPQINAFTATAAASALTVSETQISLAFRSTTLGSGAVTYVTGTPTNLVIPSGATLGTVSAVQSRIVVLALNNAGTIELAVVNIVGGNDLSETGLISTTAISAGSTSASVVYSNTARTGVAYRVVGYIESTQATAGTWATAPSTIQGVGGQALTAMSSLGYGQKWQAVSRTINTVYYNTTGKPIVLSGFTGSVSTPGVITIVVNGVNACQVYAAAATFLGVAIIPPNASYNWTNSGSCSEVWQELR
jgi:hypothetical protein